MRQSPGTLLLSLFVLGVLFAQPALAGEVIRVDKENGLLENLQVALLVLSAIAFLVPVARAERSYRCVLLGGVMLCFSFILRELDVEDLPVPQWVIAIGSGAGRDILLGTGWVAVGVLAIQSRIQIIASIKPIVFCRTTLVVVIAGFILVSGSFFDHKDNKVAADQLAEELIEVVGYGTLLVGALLARFTARSLSAKLNP